MTFTLDELITDHILKHAKEYEDQIFQDMEDNAYGYSTDTGVILICISGGLDK